MMNDAQHQRLAELNAKYDYGNGELLTWRESVEYDDLLAAAAADAAFSAARIAELDAADEADAIAAKMFARA